CASPDYYGSSFPYFDYW
nr:immunoglobulin heavy chain junction region [Mus musculus]